MPVIPVTQPVIYTGGTFDLFHRGHVEFLFQLKHTFQYGNLQSSVIVGLNTDEFIEEYKGRKPIQSYEERLVMLESCRYVDGVVKNVGGADSKPAISNVSPDFVAIGSDWHDRDYLSQMQFDWDWLAEMQIKLLYVPRVTRWSTTELKQRVLDDSGASSSSETTSSGAIESNISIEADTELADNRGDYTTGLDFGFRPPIGS